MSLRDQRLQMIIECLGGIDGFNCELDDRGGNPIPEKTPVWSRLEDDELPWVLHVDMDNNGNLVYSDEDLDRLEARGYVYMGEFLAHPDHWRIVSDDESVVSVIVGYDTRLAPLTPVAEAWGRAHLCGWEKG